MRRITCALSCVGLLAAGVAGATNPATVGQAADALDPLLEQAVGYYTGTIGRVDDPRAHELLIEAVRDGDPLSQMWLARCHSRGRMLFARDEVLAARLAAEVIDQVREFAEQDSAEAAFLMGTAYAEGLGVGADTGLAIAWYHRAADLDNTLAQHNLGNSYRAGDGVAQDAGMAAYWYRRAALQGDALPALWLGQMYEQGEGVPQSIDEAIRWYRLSADKGNAAARDALTRLRVP